MTGSRRRPRGRLLVAAVGMMTVATLLMAGAVVSGRSLLVGAAGVVALAAGWCGLRLLHHLLREERTQHAAERAAMARAHGSEVAEIVEEHRGFVQSMRHRLEQRNRRIAHLEDTVTHAELRAVEAESTSAAFRGLLDEAQAQIEAMAALMDPALADPLDPATDGTGPAGLRDTLVPEWARLEVDPTAALLAWETHADEVAGRHRQTEDPSQRKRA